MEMLLFDVLLSRKSEDKPAVRAWLWFLTEVCTGHNIAPADLGEAWEIAERVPMCLHMADIHLYRARLFGIQNRKLQIRNEPEAYPWESPAANPAVARKPIEQYGYWRCKEKLEDAEKALGIIPETGNVIEKPQTRKEYT